MEPTLTEKGIAKLVDRNGGLRDLDIRLQLLGKRIHKPLNGGRDEATRWLIRLSDGRRILEFNTSSKVFASLDVIPTGSILSVHRVVDTGSMKHKERVVAIASVGGVDGRGHDVVGRPSARLPRLPPAWQTELEEEEEDELPLVLRNPAHREAPAERDSSPEEKVHVRPELEDDSSEGETGHRGHFSPAAGAESEDQEQMELEDDSAKESQAEEEEESKSTSSGNIRSLTSESDSDRTSRIGTSSDSSSEDGSEEDAETGPEGDGDGAPKYDDDSEEDSSSLSRTPSPVPSSDAVEQTTGRLEQLGGECGSPGSDGDSSDEAESPPHLAKHNGVERWPLQPAETISQSDTTTANYKLSWRGNCLLITMEDRKAKSAALHFHRRHGQRQ